MSSSIAFAVTVAFFVFIVVFSFPKWDRECQCFYLTKRGEPVKKWEIEPADLPQWFFYIFTCLSYAFLIFNWVGAAGGKWDSSAIAWGWGLYFLQWACALCWFLERHTTKLEIFTSIIILVGGPLLELCVFSNLTDLGGGVFRLDFSNFMLVTPFVHSAFGLSSEAVFQPLIKSFRRVESTDDKKPAEKKAEAKPAPEAKPQPAQATAANGKQQTTTAQNSSAQSRDAQLRNVLRLKADEKPQGFLFHAFNMMCKPNTYPHKNFQVLLGILKAKPDLEYRRNVVIAINSLWYAITKGSTLALDDEDWTAVHALALYSPEKSSGEWRKTIIAQKDEDSKLDKLYELAESLNEVREDPVKQSTSNMSQILAVLGFNPGSWPNGIGSEPLKDAIGVLVQLDVEVFNSVLQRLKQMAKDGDVMMARAYLVHIIQQAAAQQ